MVYKMYDLVRKVLAYNFESVKAIMVANMAASSLLNSCCTPILVYESVQPNFVKQLLVLFNFSYIPLYE